MFSNAIVFFQFNQQQKKPLPIRSINLAKNMIDFQMNDSLYPLLL